MQHLMGGLLAECPQAQAWLEIFALAPGRMLDALLTATIRVVASIANRAKEAAAAVAAQEGAQADANRPQQGRI